MKLLVATLAAVFATSALADGFVCTTSQNDLKVRVYNQTQPEMGTRNVAVMILSNPLISQGRKTIATFSDINNTVVNTGATYLSKVDLRFSTSNRRGEDVLSTKLGYISSILLDIDFSYAYPVSAGTVVDGQVTILKRNGDTIVEPVSCERYLKN